jgi:hypothetical protein
MKRSTARRWLWSIVLAALIIGSASVLFLKRAYVVPVIMYHSIDYNDQKTKLSVSPESFERQMEFLRVKRYNVIRL